MVTKDIGFVLKRYNFRETSLIASIYTLNFGKIVGIFKGFYTKKNEFITHLEPCSLNEFIFYPKKREIWLVSKAELFGDFSFIREDFDKSRIARICGFVLEKAMPLWDVNKEVFYLFKDTLEHIDKAKDLDLVLFTFLIKFLTFSGFKPQFNRCISCNSNLNSNKIFFSIKRGGLLCYNCTKDLEDYQSLSPEVAQSILYIQNNQFSLVLRLKVSLDCKKEIKSILERFLNYHLDFDILL